MNQLPIKTLVIENDPYIREALVELYVRFSQVVDEAESVDAAKKKLSTQTYNVASIDLNLTDDGEQARDGLKLLPIAKKQGALCFILSAYKDKETIGQASSVDGEVIYIKKGNLFGANGIEVETFSEYITKPIIYHFHNPLDKILKKKFVTNNDSLKGRLDEVFRCSLNSNQSIMLLGETGVGKTFLADILDEALFEVEQSINDQKKKRNFHHVNLKSINKEQFQATLFGARKGAYTGLTDHREGLFTLANGGTLFLDEIGTIPLEFQEILLTALDPDENGYVSYQEMGASKGEVKKSKFRLMTGTCDDLEKLFQDGKLREDFYYRVSASNPLKIPSLRDRSEDITPLIDSFLEKCPRAITITNEAMQILVNYQWAGNIRQLEKVINDLSKGKQAVIKKFDLPLYIISNENPLVAKEQERLFSKFIKKYIQKHGLNDCIKVIEQEAFRTTYSDTNEQISTTADVLGIGRNKAYAIQRRIESNNRGTEHV